MIQPLFYSMLFFIQPGTNGVQSHTEQPAAQQEQQLEPMAPELARARIAEAISDAYEFDERVKLLSEVFSRCDDPHYRASAAYNLGALMVGVDEHMSRTIEDGIAWLKQADTAAASPSLRANARYNIGHARYMLAHAQLMDAPELSNPDDLNAMVRLLQTTVDGLIESAGAFRSVHEVDPRNSRAIENLERVRREIRQLREQIEALKNLIEQQEQQRQEQQRQNEQAAERLNELAQQQQEEANQNASENPQDPEQQQAEQRELDEKTQDEQERLNESNPDQDDQLQSIQEQLQRARDAQAQAQEALQEGKQQEAAQHQQEAADALQQAAQQLGELSDQQAQQDQEGQQGEGEQQGEPQEGEGQGNPQEDPQDGEGDEINEIAEMLLDKERREREARRVYRSTGRPVRVEKDW
ncbi:MAG: DUF4175 family protein [Phycisphaerales bacterium JB052]